MRRVVFTDGGDASDAWAPEMSVHREKAIEHLFLGELSRQLLLETGQGPEILKAEHDSYGYDVVLEVASVVRHVQLKITRSDGKRHHVDVANALTSKPGGCVLWLFVDPLTYEIGPYYWLGGLPGRPLPDLGERPALHSKANARGEKAERPGLRRVAKGRFERFDTIAEVAEALFGTTNYRLLRTHIMSRTPEPWPKDQAWLHAVRPGYYAAIPHDLDYASAVHLAHMIDGYELALAAGLGDGFAYADRALREAEEAGGWDGDALELWTSLFLEHRRDRFSGVEPEAERVELLDKLVSALRAKLTSDDRGN